MNYSAKHMSQIFGAGNHSAAVTASEAATLANYPQEIAVHGVGGTDHLERHEAKKPGRYFSQPGFIMGV